MTNSRSITSISSWSTTPRNPRRGTRLAAALACLVIWALPAHAGGRKRIVVVEFEGPKADKFHDDVVRLIKKNHTVVPTEKWAGIAEEMDAGKLTDKNVKKIAKKLKIDGVITGKIEKRRDEYIIQIKLRAGTSGEVVGNRVDTKSDGPRIDGKASRDIKEELLPAIDELEANHGGASEDEDADSKPVKKKKVADEGDEEGKPAKKAKKSSDDEEDKPAKKAKKSSDDEEDKPAKKSKKSDDEDGETKHGGFSKRDDESRGGDKVGKKAKSDDDEDKPSKKAKKADDEDKPAKKSKRDDDEVAALSTKHDDEESPLPKTKKRPKSADDEDAGDDEKPRKKKKVAKADDEEDGGSAEAEADTETDAATTLSPSERAIDAMVGMSFVARSLKFTYDTDLATPPPGYSQSLPVAGAVVDVMAFPLAFGHKRHDVLAGLGFSVLYDKVLVINSQKSFVAMDGTKAVAKIPTSESRFGVGAVFRYPLGKGASAPVVGGRLGYIGQAFSIGSKLPNGDPVDIPSVAYSMVELGGLIRYPATPKIVVNGDASLLVVTGTGDMQSAEQYGKGSVLGFQFTAGLDYLVTKNIFLRGSLRVERFGYKFDGTGKQTTMRDSDPAQDVGGASDLYYGGTAAVGYLY
ncbi:MAG: hypothetical protein JWO36_529 [Myxococcales bacterium]|nr:hypothetical protein [Myxococcales bacterium]